jgi:hypothetical protein
LFFSLTLSILSFSYVEISLLSLLIIQEKDEMISKLNNEISTYEKDNIESVREKNKVLISPNKLYEIQCKDERINDLNIELDQLRVKNMFNSTDIEKENIDDLNKQI